MGNLNDGNLPHKNPCHMIELGRQSKRQTIYCNYWCARPGFWARWGREIVFPIIDRLENDRALSRTLFREVPFRSPTPAFFIVFIYERLMSYYIETKGVDAIVFPWSAEQILALNWHPLMKDYLEKNLPWIDQVDRSGQWTNSHRARLDHVYEALLNTADIGGHEANCFDLLDYDLPARKPPARGR